MIAYIKGKMIIKGDNYVVLQSNGIGYKVFVTPAVAPLSLGAEAAFHVHTHVREDALQLFGFETREELEFFEMLNTVSGVGPKMAMSILSSGNLGVLKKAISAADHSLFIKIAGVGRKTAEKIILELKEKIGSVLPADKNISGSSELIGALEGLGYSGREIKEVISKIDYSLVTEEKLKQALKLLGR